ncbi:hypothetical protein FGB62_329g011 [Gracilaria domingensis]|nr:hypothetical protein FGB62_329g011 [Gracilaria domingensis]
MASAAVGRAHVATSGRAGGHAAVAALACSAAHPTAAADAWLAHRGAARGALRAYSAASGRHAAANHHGQLGAPCAAGTALRLRLLRGLPCGRGVLAVHYGRLGDAEALLRLAPQRLAWARDCVLRRRGATFLHVPEIFFPLAARVLGAVPHARAATWPPWCRHRAAIPPTSRYSRSLSDSPSAASCACLRSTSHQSSSFTRLRSCVLRTALAEARSSTGGAGCLERDECPRRRRSRVGGDEDHNLVDSITVEPDCMSKWSR